MKIEYKRAEKDCPSPSSGGRTVGLSFSIVGDFSNWFNIQ
jgi:hypothetical protein